MRWGLMQVGRPFLCLTAEGLESAPKPGIDLGFLREKQSIPTHLHILRPASQSALTSCPDRNLADKNWQP